MSKWVLKQSMLEDRFGNLSGGESWVKKNYDSISDIYIGRSEPDEYYTQLTIMKKNKILKRITITRKTLKYARKQAKILMKKY